MRLGISTGARNSGMQNAMLDRGPDAHQLVDERRGRGCRLVIDDNV